MEQAQTLWHYKPSQAANLGVFLSCCLIFTWPWALWRYFLIRSTEYRLEKDKFYVRQGILELREEEVLLYKITDLQIRQSFLDKITGISGIIIKINSHLVPVLKLEGLEDASVAKNIILHQVSEVRKGIQSLKAEDA